MKLNMGIDFKDENIIIGRNQSYIDKYGEKGTGYIGKVVVSAGDEPVLGKKVLMDLSKSHVMIVCGKRGGGKCVTGDTLVTLEDGSEIPIQDLTINKQKILAINNNLKIESIKKDEFFKRKVNKLLKITLRTGKEIKLTPQHPLLTINGWIEAKDLKVKSRIGTPRKIICNSEEKLSISKIKLISYLIAEGHLSNNFILFCNADEKIVNDFKEAIFQFDNTLLINNHGKYNYRVVNPIDKKRKIILDKRKNGKFEKGIQFDKKSTLHKYLSELKLYGLLSKNKYIPEIIFKLSNKDIALFLNRLFSCDGTIYKDGNRYRVSYGSASKKMIIQVQSLLLRFGLISKIRTKKRNKFVNYELEVLEEHVTTFVNEIGFFGEKEKRIISLLNKSEKKHNPNLDTIPKEIWNIYRPKNWANIGKTFKYKNPKSLRSSINYSPSREKLLEIAKADKNKEIEKIANSDIFWDEIKEIEELNGSFEVYDISVPKNHNFIANGIIVHNSYSMSVIIEEFCKQPYDVKERLSAIIIDTVGIFWTMKYANKEEGNNLDKWGLKAEGIDIRNMIPFGKQEFYKSKNIPFDVPFSIRTSQMDLEDWLGIFRLTWKDPETALLSRTMDYIKEKVGTLYDVEDIIKVALKDQETNQDIKNSLVNRMKVANGWGLFSKTGTTTKDFAKPGTITVIDVSTYKQTIGMEAVSELIVGLLGKRLYEERMLYRKEEEMNLLEGKRKESEMPIIWMMIDEAHMFMPQDRPSMALDVLLQWIRVGRQPGLSLLLATQRPNKLHSEAISQCDIFLSMRMTAQDDINAVSAIRPSYLNLPIDKFYAQMPKSQGYAILLDDNSEKMMLIKIRPRLTWDGGKTANVFID